MVRICSIDAVIAGGKSTLIDGILQKVKDDKKFMLVPEPVGIWCSIKLSTGKDFLAAFYDDMHTNALSFQIVALYTRRQLMLQKIKEAEEIEKEIGEEVILITERTILSDYYIFTKMLIEQGVISEHGKIAYEMWYNDFSKEVHINKSIYIRISPTVCFNRVQKRNRNGEDGITLDYLEDLHKFHEIFNEQILSKADSKIISNEFELGTSEYDLLLDEVIKYFSE